MLDGIRRAMQMDRTFQSAQKFRKDQTLSQFAPKVEFKEIPKIPTEFVEWIDGVGINLSAGQRVLCAISFDGANPCDFEGAERELAREMFGDIDVIPDEVRHTVCWFKGARMGGSYLCALYLLFLGLTVPVELAPGEDAFCLIVAPTMDMGKQPYKYIVGAVLSDPKLAELVISKPGIHNLRIRRPLDGQVVLFQVTAASPRGTTLRSRSLIAALLDECCFFRDPESGAINDTELKRAIEPRLVTGGKCLIISTAWARRGLLWDLTQKNFGHPQTCMSAIVPTLLVRDTEQNRRIYNELSESDPDNAEREFNCIALSVGASDFFDKEALDACIDNDVPALSPIYGLLTSFAGLDTGFKRDASAIVIVRNEPTLNNRILVSECFNRPSEKEGASPKVVLSEFKERLDAHQCKVLGCDQHYIQTVRDELKGFRVNECPPTNEFKYQSYCLARDLIRANRVVISAKHKKLLIQLRDVQIEPTSAGGMKLRSPRYDGGHGDLASAFVLALWSASPLNKPVDIDGLRRLQELIPRRRM